MDETRLINRVQSLVLGPLLHVSKYAERKEDDWNLSKPSFVSYLSRGAD